MYKKSFTSCYVKIDTLVNVMYGAIEIAWESEKYCLGCELRHQLQLLKTNLL